MELPPKGSLNGISFITLLLDVTESRLTGMIRMESGSIIKVVYLQQGNIAFASSNEKTDRLTEVLKRAGKLTPEQIEHAQARLKPNVSLGKTLVELGYINPKDLLWGARMQVEGILHQLLFWKEGNYQIIEGPLPREIVSLNMPVVQIIYDGILKTQDRSWVLEHIGSPQAVYALSPEFHEKNAQYKLPPLEVVSRVNARRTLEEIAVAAGMEAFEVCKTAAALQILKLLQKVESEPEITLREETPAPTAVIEAMDVPQEPFAQPVSLGQVLQIPTVEELQMKPASTRHVGEEAAAEPTFILAPAVEEEKPEPPTVIIPPQPEPPVFDEESDSPLSAPTIIAEKPVFYEEDEQDTEDVTPVEPPLPAMHLEEEDEEESAAPKVQFTESPIGRPEISVPLQSIATSRSKRDRTMHSSFNWKKIALLTAVLAAVAIGVVTYMRSQPTPATDLPSPSSSTSQLKTPEQEKPSRAPAPVADEPAAATPVPSEPKPAEPKPIEPKQAEPAPKTATPSPGSPLGLLQAGKLPQAATAWKKSLNPQRSRYTIQLEIACQHRTVDEAFELLSGSASELAIVPLNYRGQACYRVLYGVYPSQAQADAARGKLPSIFLKQLSPAQVIPISKALK